MLRSVLSQGEDYMILGHCSNSADPTSGLHLRRYILCILNLPATNKPCSHETTTRIHNFFYPLSHDRLHFLPKRLFFLKFNKFHTINLAERRSTEVSRHRTPHSGLFGHLRRDRNRLLSESFGESGRGLRIPKFDSLGLPTWRRLRKQLR